MKNERHIRPTCPRQANTASETQTEIETWTHSQADRWSTRSPGTSTSSCGTSGFRSHSTNANASPSDLRRCADGPCKTGTPSRREWASSAPETGIARCGSEAGEAGAAPATCAVRAGEGQEEGEEERAVSVSPMAARDCAGHAHSPASSGKALQRGRSRCGPERGRQAAGSGRDGKS